MKLSWMLPLALLAGCSSDPGSAEDSDKPSKANTPLTDVIDAVISPVKIKRIPLSEQEDDSKFGSRDVEVRPAVNVKFGTLVVDTPVPGMGVVVDGQPVGKSKSVGNGRGTLSVKAVEGVHVVVCGGREERVAVHAADGAATVKIEPFRETAEGEPK